VAFLILIGLLPAMGGRAGEVEHPSPPPTWNQSLRTEGFDIQELTPLQAHTQALILTPHLSQRPLARTDPRHGWQFSVACYGYFRTEHQSLPELRFRVYAQQMGDLPKAQRVCRLLLRLQETAWQKLRLQVNLQGERTLNVWLCRQGNSGGEQWRNNLYLYSIEEIRRHMDWLREVAHEFSHAIIPGITGYAMPEPWANGYMGERLFMTWLDSMFSSGQVGAEDVCGATATDIRAFVQQRCVPLRDKWFAGFPQRDFARTDATGMGTLIGLALYIDSVYGSSMLRAAFARLASPQPKAFWQAFTEAVQEADRLQVTLPGGKAQVWLPAGKWNVHSSDRAALLQRGPSRWQVTRSMWRLPESGWYHLSSKSPVQLVR
jgi:hypothetical protein